MAGVLPAKHPTHHSAAVGEELVVPRPHLFAVAASAGDQATTAVLLSDSATNSDVDKHSWEEPRPHFQPI